MSEHPMPPFVAGFFRDLLRPTVLAGIVIGITTAAMWTRQIEDRVSRLEEIQTVTSHSMDDIRAELRHQGEALSALHPEITAVHDLLLQMATSQGETERRIQSELNSLFADRTGRRAAP